MHYIEIPELKRHFNMPGELGECTPAEYVAICGLLYKYQAQEITIDEFRVLAIYELLNIKKTKKPKDKEAVDCNIYQLSLLIESFFTRDDDNHISINQNFQHNPIPKIPVAYGHYYGPQDYLRSTTFGEYVDALNIFSSYHETGETELLYNLAAVFYRPKGKKYNPKMVDKHTKKLNYTPFGFIYGVYIFFASFQHYITSATVFWEGRELDLSILFKKSSTGFESKLPSLGMKSTAYMLAQTNVLGDLEKVNSSNLWEVLLLMYDIRKNDMDEKTKQDQAKTSTK